MTALHADIGSQLIFRECADGQCSHDGAVVLLHDVNGNLDDLVPLGTSLHPSLRIYAPQAIDALCLGRYTTGYTWYHSVAPDLISPTSFKTNLWHLTRFLEDRKNEIGILPMFVIGKGQGAVMALTVATDRPDLVAGVVSIDGFLTDLGDRDAESRVDGTPVLLLESVSNRNNHALALSSSQRLTAMGATVASCRLTADSFGAGETLASRINPWMQRLMN